MDLDFFFPIWTVVLWMTGGTMASLSPLVMVFPLFSLIVVIPAKRKIKFKKKKKEEKKKSKKEEEWTILTLTSGFLVIEAFNSRYWAKPPRS